MEPGNEARSTPTKESKTGEALKQGYLIGMTVLWSGHGTHTQTWNDARHALISISQVWGNDKLPHLPANTGQKVNHNHSRNELQ